MNLVVAPWGDPIQDGRGKETKVETYDIQNLWKKSDVTPVEDTDTSDCSEYTKPRGHPYNQDDPKNKECKWIT